MLIRISWLHIEWIDFYTLEYNGTDWLLLKLADVIAQQSRTSGVDTIVSTFQAGICPVMGVSLAQLF